MFDVKDVKTCSIQDYNIKYVLIARFQSNNSKSVLFPLFAFVNSTILTERNIAWTYERLKESLSTQ